MSRSRSIRKKVSYPKKSSWSGTLSPTFSSWYATSFSSSTRAVSLPRTRMSELAEVYLMGYANPIFNFRYKTLNA